MTIDIVHAKNPAVGWDIATTITVAKGEKLTHVLIQVNGSPDYDKDITPPANSWKNTLTQKGQYPGDNKVVVTATNNKADDTVAIDEWS
jgi:hypothetical protein